MKCIRCNLEFDTSVPEINVETYGDNVYYACPNCGKLYKFRRLIKIISEEVSDEEIDNKLSCEDDWGKEVIKDNEYESK